MENSVKMVKAQETYCLATVTTESYFQWTMTMLYSFVTSNPWFTGDLVIIAKDLPAQMVRDLRMFDRVKLVEPSAQLLGKLDEFAAGMPSFADKIARFYSLEIFRMAGYDRLLFLDSDMIVVKPVEELFALPESFYASAELCWYKGKGRNAESFASGFPPAEGNSTFLEKPVNTGFMLLKSDLMNGKHFDGLLEYLSPDHRKNDNLTYTDEMVINQYFKNSIHLLDSSYNYRARGAKLLREKEQVTPGSARIIHYYSKYKPWNFSEALDATQNNMTWIRAYEIWYDCYVNFLQFCHLKNKISGMERKKPG